MQRKVFFSIKSLTHSKDANEIYLNLLRDAISSFRIIAIPPPLGHVYVEKI